MTEEARIIYLEAEIERLRAALRQIDEMRASSGLIDAVMLYEMRSIAKEALSR